MLRRGDAGGVAGRPGGNGSVMTQPENSDQPNDGDETAANTGALAAASQDGSPGTDPLGPLNRITEDDES